MDQELSMHTNHYTRLLGMTVLSFIAMYVLMYAMVDEFASVYPNLNQAYMAGLMAAPMVLIELGLMWSMYENKTANLVIASASVMLLVGFFLVIRQQTAIGDNQFLKSMIPHHSGAILMCQKASISDGEIKKLCAEIIEGQRSEIARMKLILQRLNR
jgi:uncharacterized protein (DUF305 family)